METLPGRRPFVRCRYLSHRSTSPKLYCVTAASFAVMRAPSADRDGIMSTVGHAYVVADVGADKQLARSVVDVRARQLEAQTSIERSRRRVLAECWHSSSLRARDETQFDLLWNCRRRHANGYLFIARNDVTVNDAMMTSYGDGSWELSIAVTEVGAEKSLRVKGDLHVGGLMVRLVHELGECFWAVYVYRSIHAVNVAYT